MHSSAIPCTSIPKTSIPKTPMHHSPMHHSPMHPRQAGVRKDPKNCAFVRTRLLTDFIDFLDLKSVFKSGTLKAFRFNYERFNDEKSDIRTKARGDEL